MASVDETVLAHAEAEEVLAHRARGIRLAFGLVQLLRVLIIGRRRLVSCHRLYVRIDVELGRPTPLLGAGCGLRGL